MLELLDEGQFPKEHMEIVTHAERIFNLGVFSHDPLPSWIAKGGRVVALGDACHATTPFLYVLVGACGGPQKGVQRRSIRLQGTEGRLACIYSKLVMLIFGYVYRTAGANQAVQDGVCLAMHLADMYRTGGTLLGCLSKYGSWMSSGRTRGLVTGREGGDAGHLQSFETGVLCGMVAYMQPMGNNLLTPAPHCRYEQKRKGSAEQIIRASASTGTLLVAGGLQRLVGDARLLVSCATGSMGRTLVARGLPVY